MKIAMFLLLGAMATWTVRMSAMADIQHFQYTAPELQKVIEKLIGGQLSQQQLYTMYYQPYQLTESDIPIKRFQVNDCLTALKRYLEEILQNILQQKTHRSQMARNDHRLCHGAPFSGKDGARRILRLLDHL